MRMKQFIVFWIVFTILYILFFIVYDKISDSLFQKKVKEKAYSLMNVNSYLLFASFYGIQGTATLEMLHDIYDKYGYSSRIFIDQEANAYHISSFEFCVILLYFEYLGIMNRRAINKECGVITNLSFEDSQLVNKYRPFFENHDDYSKICFSVGMGSSSHLAYIDSMFLFPGVRIVNSSVLYVGDICEEK